MKNKKQSENLEIIKTMPPLKHGFLNEEFNVKNSEAVKWLISQDDVLQWLWCYCSNNGWKDQLIKYDEDSKTWKGVDYED